MPASFSFHSLRHTHATLLLKSGVHFKIVQARLGHSTFQQTMDTYSHVTPDMDKAAAEKASSFFVVKL
ncbi:tyrosine-type recombinase/integrase [Phascolarctobacterium faecium]|uniref:tyrosine-type recombinase/integrase n=1 Tax=Phascolarctobacterium faecium TaxID=33025 RepID=UPI00307817CE